MRKTAFALALAAAAGFGTAQAQDYQMELEAGYLDFNPDQGSGDSALDFGFTYFLDRVTTAGKPLAEAAFLSNASNLGIDYRTFDDADVDSVGVRGEFWFDQLYLAAGYETEDDSGTDTDTIRARVGWMLSEGFRVAAGLNRVDVDLPGADASDDIVVEAKYVAGLGGGAAFNVEGSVTFLDEADDELIELGGDYYFNPALSVGAGISMADNDDNFGLRARYFITPTIAGQLEYFTLSDGDDDAFRLSLAVRF
jgi:hypothetical protein